MVYIHFPNHKEELCYHLPEVNEMFDMVHL